MGDERRVGGPLAGPLTRNRREKPGLGRFLSAARCRSPDAFSALTEPESSEGVLMPCSPGGHTASPTGAHERARPRRCNRAFTCIIIYTRMWTCLIRWLAAPTFPGLLGNFMGPQICAHAHTHTRTHSLTHTQGCWDPSSHFLQVPDATVQHVERETFWNQAVLPWLQNIPHFHSEQG